MSINAAFPLVRARHESLTKAALRDVFKDQEVDVVVAGRSLTPEWDARLARTIYTRNRNTAADVAIQVARTLRGEFDPDVMDAWLTKNAELAAVGINDSTRASLEAAEDEDAKLGVFEILATSRAAQLALSMVTSAANFGAHDAARMAGGNSKTWVWSGKPNSRHTELAGETVPMEANFSNGMPWPGHFTGGADDNANCGCSLSFN